MAEDSGFVRSEKARLIALADASLYPPFSEEILRYYNDFCINWWGGGDRPTESPISSQVACINHLEPARLKHEVAIQFARRQVPDAAEVLPIEGGFLAYEWVGKKSYLKEHGWSPRNRGKIITSLDALMAVKRSDGEVSLIVIEWKYTECYSNRPLAVSKKGTNRVEIYRSLLEEPGCPIRLGDHERLFFDPYYQLMRQTLLAWQMIRNREFGATDWVHVHVAPKANVQLLQIVTSPQLTEFGTMEHAWKSVLVQPEKYRLVSPHEVLPSIGLSDHTDTWLDWLASRYMDGNAFELEMARGFYGYGSWDAPYWFIGPEPEMGPNQPAGNAPLLNAWLKSGKSDLCDCYEFQASIPDLTWHTGRPPLQVTWSKLILFLMTYLDQPADNDSLRAYQRDRFGRSVSGETCIIELFGLAAKTLKTSKNQGQYRQERVNHIREKMLEHRPKLVVMYGLGGQPQFEGIAGKNLVRDVPVNLGSTIIVFTKHPVAFGGKKSDWEELGKKLRTSSG